MEWNDDGFVLSARRHGENAAIVSLLTRDHGRHAGLVHGGAGRRARGVYQAGNLVHARWRARLSEHLGTYRCELAHAYAAAFLSERLRLLALAAAVATLDRLLPEREPQPRIFEEFRGLVDGLAAGGDWGAGMVRWELALLGQLGYGLDLSRCAATGATADLAWVSPRSGSAVSAEAGRPWRARLLRLPQFLRSAAPAGTSDVVDGFALTGHFLERCARETAGEGLPQARAQMVEALRRDAAVSA